MNEILQRARDADIGHIVNICSKVSQFETVVRQANEHKMLSCTFGTHPHYASEIIERNITVDDFVKAAQDNAKIIAIGETGLDDYYRRSPTEHQVQSFRLHIRAALELDMPVIIHARDSDDLIMQIIREESPNGKLKGILHCFSSGAGLAQAGLDYGLYVSFSGIVTFKNAHDVRAVARDIVPLERLIIETDAPYLSPVPKRGQVCEPSFLVHTAQFLAELKECDISDIQNHTTENFFTLFPKARQYVAE